MFNLLTLSDNKVYTTNLLSAGMKRDEKKCLRDINAELFRQMKYGIKVQIKNGGLLYIADF